MEEQTVQRHTIGTLFAAATAVIAASIAEVLPDLS